MRGKEFYNELKEVFTEFRKKDYFHTFSAADLFYIFDNEENHVLVTFIEQFFGDAYGVQCFYNRNGFNYVHDILSAKDDITVTIGDCDSIVAVYKRKEDLTEEDNNFLKAMGARRLKENNLIIYRFEKGYRHRIAKPTEIAKITLYTVFLASLIKNEYNDVIECFNLGDCVFATLNLEAMEYSSIYRPLPLLEDNPHRGPVNVPFVDEYKDKNYINDDCYLYTSYLPVTIKETKVRPLLLYFYFEKNDNMILKYILTPPKDYKNCIYGILDDIFSSLGLPAKMVINNRDIYHIITKTLDALNIENTFVRDNIEASEEIAPMLSSLYSKTLDGEMDSEETVSMLLDIISKAINDIQYDEYEEEDNKTINYVS